MNPAYWQQLTNEWAAALTAKKGGAYGAFDRELRARLSLVKALKKDDEDHRKEPE